MLRVLFVGLNYSYVNPTARLVPLMVASAAETDFFGPGFSSSETLEAGLPAFMERHGPYDAAVTTEMIIQMRAGSMSNEWFTRAVRRSMHTRFPLTDLAHVSTIADDWSRVTCTRIVSLLQSDYYCWNAKLSRNIDESADVVLALDTNRITPAAEFGTPGLEPRLDSVATDIYADFVGSQTHRIANFPHFVAAEEFCFDTFERRQDTWSVPGVEYRQRAAAKAVLRTRGYRLPRRSPAQYLGKITPLLRATPGFAIAAAQELFRRDLRRSRASYTCGSAARMTVRKYFEIPAAGALLVCQPSSSLTDYGFSDGTNCYFADGADVGSVDELLFSEPEHVAQVAARGQRLVFGHHTLSARASQLGAVLESVASASFNGASWEEGEFVIRTQESQPPSSR